MASAVASPFFAGDAFQPAARAGGARRSLGELHRAWAVAEPLPQHLARTPHTAHTPAGSLPDRDGGAACCPATESATALAATQRANLNLISRYCARI
eukprot:4449839-Prymnesium_polylepis.1